VKKETQINVIAGLLLPCLILGIFLALINGIDAKISSTALEIKGVYGTTIKIDAITSIEKLEAFPSFGAKLNGINLGFMRVGIFSYKELGKVRLFELKREKPYILIITPTEKIVLGFGKAKNESLYDALQQKTK